MQAAGAASLNQGPSDVELAKPFFDGQQLVQDDREPAGHEASARSLYTLRSMLSHFLLNICCCILGLPLILSTFAVQDACNRHEHCCIAACQKRSNFLGLKSVCVSVGALQARVWWLLWFICWSVAALQTKPEPLALSATWPLNPL